MTLDAAHNSAALTRAPVVDRSTASATEPATFDQKPVPLEPAPPLEITPAAYAATLNARQLAISLDYAFRLEGFDDDLAVISRVRSRFPRELGAARKIVHKHLGDAPAWHRRATGLFHGSDYGRDAQRVPRWARVRWAILLMTISAIAGTAVFAATFDLTHVASAVVIAALGFLVVSPPPIGKNVPEIPASDMVLLREDVVDATLVALIARDHGDGTLTPAEVEALTRSWHHLRFIGYTTEAMATPPMSRLALVDAA